MGKALSLMKRPLRDFNLESRAHKIISKDKPMPAPRHNQTEIEQLLKDHPDVYAESLKKNDALDEHLKNVYVVTQNPEKSKESSSRPLPTNRHCVDDYEYGFNEPQVIPEGKTTLRRAMQFISDHQLKPEIYSVERIAKEQSLSESTIKQILQYFRVFEVYLPQERQTKANFAGPSIPRTKIVIEKRRLEAGKRDRLEAGLGKHDVT